MRFSMWFGWRIAGGPGGDGFEKPGVRESIRKRLPSESKDRARKIKWSHLYGWPPCGEVGSAPELWQRALLLPQRQPAVRLHKPRARGLDSRRVAAAEDGAGPRPTPRELRFRERGSRSALARGWLHSRMRSEEPGQRPRAAPATAGGRCGWNRRASERLPRSSRRHSQGAREPVARRRISDRLPPASS